MVRVPMRITPPGRCPWPRPLTAPHTPEWRSVAHLMWMTASLPNQRPNSTLLNPYADLWVKGTMCTVLRQLQVGTNLVWCPNLVVWEWDWGLLYCLGYCNVYDESSERWSDNATIQFGSLKASLLLFKHLSNLYTGFRYIPKPVTTPSANKNFSRHKMEMAQELFELFNSTVFENKVRWRWYKAYVTALTSIMYYSCLQTWRSSGTTSYVQLPVTATTWGKGSSFITWSHWGMRTRLEKECDTYTFFYLAAGLGSPGVPA